MGSKVKDSVKHMQGTFWVFSISNFAPTSLSSDWKVLILCHSQIFVTHMGVHMRKCSYFVTDTFSSLTGGLSKQYTADMYGQTHKQTDKPDLLRK